MILYPMVEVLADHMVQLKGNRDEVEQAMIEDTDHTLLASLLQQEFQLLV